MGTKMGFEGELYYGEAGATASTKIKSSRDINYNLDPDKAETTARGEGETPPIKTQQVTAIGASIEFTVVVKDDDGAADALQAASASGAPVAIRTKSYKTGKGFDGDCIITAKQGIPLNGEQTLQVTADPTDKKDRIPKLFV
jgi:hypothetical protein